MNKSTTLTLVLLLSLLPATSMAWWNDGWNFRKQIRIEAPTAVGSATSVPVLVRLSIGNFAFFGDVMPDGSDIRFVGADDTTPLPFYIEKFDPVNQQALIWVQVPQVVAGAAQSFVYMYYGNPEAAAASDSSAVHGTDTVLLYDFSPADGPIVDRSGYGNDAIATSATATEAALIGDGIELTGTTTIVAPATPALAVTSENGFTASLWLRPGELPVGDASLLSVSGPTGRFELGLRGTSPRLTVAVEGVPVDIVADGLPVALDEWVNLAARLDGTAVELYGNGELVAQGEVPSVNVAGDWTLGDPVIGFSGQVDQVRLASAALDPAMIRVTAQTEAPFSAVVIYGEDAQREDGGGESYFAITLRNVTVDGWVVIALLAVMAIVSWVVMAMKSMLLSRIERQNAHFMTEYMKLSGDPLALDQDAPELDTLTEEPLLSTALEDEDSYQPSTLFPLYHTGALEVKKRINLSPAVGADASRTLSSQAIEAIRSSIDGSLVRQRQKMNRLMVLLTIAISGGPFLGLLGTVVGVMITFAAIAASGDVNVNSIAPGIAAALVATVAGLVVAIPALFAYNWLGSRIKDIDANTQVFADEFINRIAEYYC